MKQEKKTFVVLYTLKQIDEMQSYLEKENIPLSACTIIPLEFEIEHALRERNIPYESLLKYVPIEEDFGDVLDSARSSAKRFHEHPAMRFYAYQGINIGEVFEPMIDLYLEYLGRYTAIFKRIAEIGEVKKLIIPHTTMRPTFKVAALVPFEFRAPVDAAILVGKQKGFEVQTIGTPLNFVPISKKQRITRCFGILALAFYNACIRLCIRPRPLKLYASEYWFHIESFIEKMDDVELVFMERKEIRNIPWRQLLKHRIRFLHSTDVVDANIMSTISQSVLAFAKQWHAVKNEVREIFDIVPGIDAWPAIERALTFLIETQTQRALVDIEGLRRIMQKERPDKVLLRASVGGAAHHFYIATQVAHQLGIPSIEVQHAGAVVDPRSAHSHLTASYLAAYGPLTRDVYHKNHGYARERIRPIGSPRFDHYVHEHDTLAQNRIECLIGLGLDHARPTVFVAVPFPGAYPLLFSSYQVADFFNTFRNIQKKMPELQFIFKFRLGSFSPFYRDDIHNLFTDGGVVVTDTKDFLSLIVASDIACTGSSTLMYEIMLGERPMILFPWQKWDTYTLGVYSRAASVAFDVKELLAFLRQLLNKDEAEKAVKRQNNFLSENYSFDGHAPERMASLLREKLLPLP